MSRTIRKIIKRQRGIKWMRKPKFMHKLMAGQSPKSVTTDWHDKPIVAIKEMKHKL